MVALLAPTHWEKDRSRAGTSTIVGQTHTHTHTHMSELSSNQANGPGGPNRLPCVPVAVGPSMGDPAVTPAAGPQVMQQCTKAVLVFTQAGRYSEHTTT